MAVTTSPRLGITLWSVGTDPFSRAQMSASHTALEAAVAAYDQGLTSARPLAGTEGRFYYSTDDGILSYDDGVEWQNVLFDAVVRSPREKTNVVATSVPAALNIDTDTAATWYYTVASAANFTVNIRKSASETLDSLMDVGDAMQISLLVTNTTARSITAFTIDGAAATTRWIYGGAAPTGDANAVDAYAFNIIKTAAATFHVFLSMTKYA